MVRPLKTREQLPLLRRNQSNLKFIKNINIPTTVPMLLLNKDIEKIFPTYFSIRISKHLNILKDRIGAFLT